MKVSLKSKIYQLVKDKSYARLDEIHEIAAEGNYKQSTSEKKSRELAEIGSIIPDYNHKGHLVGYSIGKNELITRSKPILPPISVFHTQCGTLYQKEVKTSNNALCGQLQLL